MRLGDLKIGDKFRFPEGHPNYNYGRPYLIIDLNFKNMTLYSDFSNLSPVLDLTTYKIMCFSKEFDVEQDKDNIPV